MESLFAVLLILAFSISICSKDDGKNSPYSLSGTWKFTSAKYNGPILVLNILLNEINLDIYRY